MGWLPPTIVTAMAVAAFVSPRVSVLVLAGLGPIAGIVFVLTRAEPRGLPFDEAVVLAFIAGWSVRRALAPLQHRSAPAFRQAITLLLAVALTSAAVVLVNAAAAEPSTSFWSYTSGLVLRDYLVGATPLLAPMLFVEGLVLSLILADWCAADRHRRDAVLRMMVAGATAAASFNVLRLVMAAVPAETPWTAFATLLAAQRVNVHYADLNAAGSYFAMMLFIAFGVAAQSRKALATIPIITAGLWISGSRSAMAAALLMAAVVVGVRLWRWSGRRVWPVLAVAALLLVVTAGAWKWYPEGRNETFREALSFRIDAADAAVRVTAAHPWFGAGLGRFYALSEPYIGIRENAHNNFLQVMSELGVPGVALFLLAIGAALRAAWRHGGSPGPTSGLLAGLVVYLLTCLAGHPLLVAGAAYPFWLAVGLAAATSGSGTGLSRRMRLVSGAVLLIVAVTLPFRIAEARRTADVEHASVGMSLWQREPDGSRFRWAGGRSTFFVPEAARAVRIPLRHGGQQLHTLQVRIFLDGREADRILLERGGEWRIVRVVLPGGKDRPFYRIDLEAGAPGSEAPMEAEATGSGGVLAVGRPEIEAPAS